MRVIFVDELDSSRANGIGTFRRMLLPRLEAAEGTEIIVMGLNSGADRPAVNETDTYTEYFFPIYENGGWRGNGAEIFDLFAEAVEDNTDNVFIINHSPCAPFIEELKKRFPKSKVMFVIHDQGWCGPLLGDVKLLRKIFIEGKTPKSVSQETADHVREYCAMEQAIYEIADGIVALSPTCRRTLMEIYGVPGNKIHVIPNGFIKPTRKRLSRKEARRRIGIGEDEDIVIFAGRTVRHKGIEPLLRAIALLRKRHPKLRCVMCGSLAGFSNYSSLIEPVATSLIMTGFISRERLLTWYDAADVGVMPSYSEPFGYSGIEMSDAGLPVVVADGHCLPDIYEDGVNGFVARIGNDVTHTAGFSRSLAEKIEEALTCDSKTRQRIVSEARRRIDTRYAADIMAQTYLQLFREL